MPRLRHLVPMLVLGVVACGNAGEDLGFGVHQAPGIEVTVFFDRDWSGDRTSVDSLGSGVLVTLFPLNGLVPVMADTTTTLGVVSFPALEPGYYRVRVDSAMLGDSLAAVAAPGTDTVRAGGNLVRVQVSLAPPVFTIEAVRGGAVGAEVVVPAVVAAGGQHYADHSTFLRDATGALRLIHVSNLNGRDYNEPGEVVRVRGRIGLFNGQTVLDSAQIYLADNTSEGPPDTLTTAQAASAAGGAADARLVRIMNATILDTATAGGAFLAGVDDGSGRLVVRIDPLLFAHTTDFVPGARLDATGALAAMGGNVWELWPRAVTDYQIF